MIVQPDKAISIAAPPNRRAGSVRRTVSLQCGFPDGPQGNIRIVGNGRDLFTGHKHVSIVSTQRLELSISPSREIIMLHDVTKGRNLRGLEGVTLGKPLRQAAEMHLAGEMAAHSLLARMIAEIPAIAFLSRGAWLTWIGDQKTFIEMFGPSSGLNRPVEGLCFSYAPGSIALSPNGTPNEDLLEKRIGRFPRHPDDTWDWHAFDRFDGPELSRVRYTDVWLDDAIHVESAFQDSAAAPSGNDVRGLYHEYHLSARICEATNALTAVDVTPGSLPFPTCLGSPQNVGRLLGRSTVEFGKLVPAELPGIAGCTHLNETLKMLEDIPALAQLLRRTL